jgi:prolipoprotein diacylglyceryltransferase
VFQVGGGGMSSHGGMIGVALVGWFYARRSRAKLDNNSIKKN